MAKRVIQMYDKYKSTTKVYPKVIEECLPEDYKGLPDTVDDLEEAVEDIPTIVANPDPAGETELTGLQIGDTKYKVGGGKQLYKHILTFSSSSDKYVIITDVINDSPTQMTMEDFAKYIRGKGFNNSTKLYPCCGCQSVSPNLNVYFGFYADNNSYPTGICKKSDSTDSAGTMTYASFSDTVIAL